MLAAGPHAPPRLTTIKKRGAAAPGHGVTRSFTSSTRRSTAWTPCLAADAPC